MPDIDPDDAAFGPPAPSRLSYLDLPPDDDELIDVERFLYQLVDAIDRQHAREVFA